MLLLFQLLSTYSRSIFLRQGRKSSYSKSWQGKAGTFPETSHRSPGFWVHSALSPTTTQLPTQIKVDFVHVVFVNGLSQTVTHLIMSELPHLFSPVSSPHWRFVLCPVIPLDNRCCHSRTTNTAGSLHFKRQQPLWEEPKWWSAFHCHFERHNILFPEFVSILTHLLFISVSIFTCTSVHS